MRYQLEMIHRVVGDNLLSLVDQAKIGEKILLWRGFCSSWEVSDDGKDFYHEDQGIIYKNGVAVLTGCYDYWSTTPNGLVFQESSKLVRENGEVLFEGEFSDWCPHADGVAVLLEVEKEGGKERIISLNGKRTLCKAPGFYPAVRSHPKGFLCREDSVWSINGSKFLFEERRTKKNDPAQEYESWGEYDYIVHRGSHEFLLNESKIIYCDWCDEWATVSNGLILRQGEKFYLVILRK